MSIDLLKIPGIYLRPPKPAETLNIPGTSKTLTTPAVPAREVKLHSNGEADWQYLDGTWSSSGHWKIVKGRYLSIVEINPDPMAIARGETCTEQYYRINSIEEDHADMQEISRNQVEVWVRVDKHGSTGRRA